MAQQCTRLAEYTGRLGFAREALRFVDRAADAARYEPSPVLHCLVSMRRSVAHAQLGDEVAFRAAITTARRELDRGPHETDPTWTKFIRHSEITVCEAGGWRRLGSPAQAVKLIHAALDDTARSPRDRALQRASLAGALMHTGDLSQAISHSLMILPDLGTTLTSGRALQRLQPVREAADAAGAVEFCDQFDAAARAFRAT